MFSFYMYLCLRVILQVLLTFRKWNGLLKIIAQAVNTNTVYWSLDGNKFWLEFFSFCFSFC